MRRKILQANVKRVALCKRGANRLSTLYKSEDGATLQALCKSGPSFDEQGELLAVVAAPGWEDADGDTFADASTVRDSMHTFMRNGAELDIEHDGVALEKTDAHVAEVFTIQDGDPRFSDWKDYDGKTVDVSGGWGMVIQIDNPDLRKAYRAGDWDGVSLFAPKAHLQLLEKSDQVQDDIRAVLREAGLLKTHNEEIPMTPDELNAALDKRDASLIEKLTKALTPEAVAPVVPVVPEAIPFAGDLNKAEDVQAHIQKVALSKIDVNDPAALETHLAALNKSEEKPKAETPEVIALKKRLATLQKSSNQGDGETKVVEGDEDFSEHPLVKSGVMTSDEFAMGAQASAAATYINTSRVPVTK